VQCLTDEIPDQQLAAAAQHSSTGLRSAEDQTLAKLPDTEVAAAMQDLPKQFAVAVFYADVVGLRYQEIASIIHAPVGTVKTRLNRGRRQLRDMLGEVAEQRGYGCCAPSRPKKRAVAPRGRPNVALMVPASPNGLPRKERNKK
jgi:RNA polymerase sigma-70 factor (ECF subfamily)